MAKNQTHQYLDNQKFTHEVTIYAQSVRDALESGDEPPPMTPYIGQSILDIANKMASRGNFVNYSYKDEMIGDSIEDCIKYLKNFNPAKLPAGKKPSAFSYVSRIIWFAFLRRLGKEDKQQQLKQKLITNAGIIDDIANNQIHDNTVYENQCLANVKSIADDYYKMAPDEDDDSDPYKKSSKVRIIDPASVSLD